MQKLIKALLRDGRGSTAIEYGLIAALVVVACVVALQLFADTSTNIWMRVSNTVSKNG